MEELVSSAHGAAGQRENGSKFYNKDFWRQENLKYAKPHFRLEKAARIVNSLSGGRPVDLLDVGCGPGTLGTLLAQNVRYHGIDIALTAPAPNLLEADLMTSPIKFADMRFGLVVAQGFFEYAGECQDQKFAEVHDLLTDDGTFLVSYVNFGHRDPEVYWPYSNVRPLRDFRDSLARSFTIRRWFPTAHNWNHSEPNRPILRMMQMPLSINIPVISPALGVEYFFLCTRK